MNYETWVPSFDLDFIELNFLVIMAAEEIDNYRGGLSKENKATKYLSQLLNELTQGKKPQGKNLTNSLILSSAISGRKKFNEYWKDKNTDELIVKTNLVAKDLRNFKELSEEKQRDLIGFCMNLNKEIIYYRFYMK